MEECKPIGTSLDVNSKLLKLTEEFQGIQEEMQGIPYKAAMGSLMPWWAHGWILHSR
jgi:hypothetical protein